MKMTFQSGRGAIEVTVDVDGNGQAYFKADDMLSDIVNGDFSHPYYGTPYRITLPSRFNGSRIASLAVSEWRTVSDAKVE